MKIIKTILLFCVFSVKIPKDTGQILPYIIACNMYDPELNICLKNTFQHLVKYLAGGLRELNVPAFDPLRIPEFDYENNADGVFFKLILWNFVARGSSDIEIVEVRSNMAKLRVELKIRIPKLVTTGFYDGNVNVIGYPIIAKGKFLAEFSEIIALGKIFGSPLTKNNEVYMNIDKVLLDYVVQNAVFKVIDELNPPLSEDLGEYLNSHSKQLVKATKNNTAKIIGEFYQDVLQSAFSAYPLKTFIKF